MFHLLKCWLTYNRLESSAPFTVILTKIWSYSTSLIWRWSPGHHCTWSPSTLFFSCLATLFFFFFCKGLVLGVRPFGTLRTKESSHSINTALLSLQGPCARSRTNFWAGSWSDIYREESCSLTKTISSVENREEINSLSRICSFVTATGNTRILGPTLKCIFEWDQQKSAF